MSTGGNGVFLSPIGDKIKESLIKRENAMSNRIDMNPWVFGRTPWARFTSLAKINDDSQIRKDWILFAGLSSDKSGNEYRSGFDEMYNIDNYSIDTSMTYNIPGVTLPTNNSPKNTGVGANLVQQPIPKVEKGLPKYTKEAPTSYRVDNSYINRPMPGIIDISVTNKGSFGSVREATVKWTCWDLNQLNIMEMLYMTPGISCLLEWGWNVDIDGNSIDYNLSSLGPMFDRCVTKKVAGYVNADGSQVLGYTDNSGGHYDAMQGLINNFSWTLRNDGGFDCITTITSMGASFLSIDSHSKSKNIGASSVDDESMKSIEENIMATLWQTFDRLSKDKRILSDDIVHGLITDKNSAKDQDESEWWNEEKPTDGTNVGNMYVTLEYFFKYFINSNYSYMSETSENTDTCGEVTKEGTEEKNIFPRLDIGGVDGKGTFINYTKNIISSDVGICILPDADFTTSTTVTDLLNQYHTAIKSSGGMDLIRGRFWNEDKSKINVGAILLNLKYIYDCIKATNTVSDLVNRVLSGVSDTCGKLWEFQISVSEIDTTKLVLSDTKSSGSNDLKTDAYVFKVNNINTIVTELSVNTEVDSKMKSMIMLGSNQSSGNSSKSNSSDSDVANYNFYGNKVTNLAIGKITPLPANFLNTDGSKSDTESEPIEKLTKEDYVNNIADTFQKVYNDESSAENVRNLLDALNKYLTEFIVEESEGISNIQPQHRYPMLPIKLNFTIDGLAGIRYGHVIDIDYKPNRYVGTTYFQITNVTHSITQGSWKTSYEAVFRVDANIVKTGVPEQANENPTPATEKQVATNQGGYSANNRAGSPNKTTIAKLNSLHPKIRPYVNQLLNDAKKVGINIEIISGLRSWEWTQAAIKRWDSGDHSGLECRPAPPGGSHHNYGLAFDMVKPITKEKILLAQNVGFKWQGSSDAVHFYMDFGMKTTAMKKKKVSGEVDADGYIIIA